MQTTKLLVPVLLVTARLCRAEVVIESLTPHQPTTDLIQDLVTIVTTCYGDRIHGLGLAGDLPDALLKTLSTQHSIPVAVIGNTEIINRTAKMPQVPIQFHQKLQIFIVGASSYQQFRNIINAKIKFSVWWNHMASFLIFDSSRTCRHILGMMATAFESDILNAKVMCYNYRGKIISTLNPFTSMAPDPWMKVAVVKGKFHRPFTIFFRKARQTASICTNFDFDKVKDCGGFPIAVKGTPPKSTKRYKSIKNQDTQFTDYRILDTVFRHLNATPLYFNDSFMYVETALASTDMLTAWNRDLVTYPHSQSELVLISQFRSTNKSHLNRLLSVIDINSGIGLVVAYLVTVIFFKFVIGQALVPAILNLIRMTCGTASKNLANNGRSRIGLTGVLFLAVTMHGIFMGNFASLLTKVIPLRNVNKIQDIFDFDYEVYGYIGIVYYLEQEVQKRYVPTNWFGDCITKVRREKSSACISSSDSCVFYQARMFNLHVSREAVLTQYRTFFVKWNWPYEERFNTLLSRLVEADVLESWDIKCSLAKLENYQTDQEVRQNMDFKKIELGELAFAFVILGVGLVLASVAFIVELEIKRKYRPRCRVGIRRRKLRN